MAVAVITFVVALAVIASERVHRTKVALLGAAIVVLFVGGEFDQEAAIEAVDFNTIGLLAGMMILVYLTQQTGVYDYIAIRAGQLSRGDSLRLVLSLAGTTALLSAFLDNLTTILLIVPVTFLIADAFDIDPLPLVIIEVIASNIGGTATLIGDPPNIIIAGATELSFNDFLVNLAPVAALAFVVVVAFLYAVYRHRLRIPERNRELVMELDAAASIRDPAELRRSGVVLIITVLAFFAHQALHIEPATVALAGAAVALLITSIPLEQALSKIEWPTLFFFVALFVMVGALEVTGVIADVAEGVQDLTGGDRTAELFGILWVGALGSGIVDNIPFTTAMIPVVSELQGADGDDSYWWALSLGACFGGNATIIAAAANVAAAGLTERAGMPIGFVNFLRIGVPATLISLAIASAYVGVRYVVL
ncbi:MAG: Citrate transporter [Solirubrobacterales bacterium]|jgi:Na+/H+ antiporter NhaD/arsenite permease-like protein|nr:Citrate transporter [Solirubrobacterales bacterium]